MPTSQWEDVDVGLGFTSIYNTGGNVGVGTEDPRTTIQAGGNVDAGERGVGISSVGNINAAGIITAASFVGDLTGNIVSASAFSGNIDLNADLDVDGHTNLDNVSISGVTTTSGNVVINADLDVDGHTNLDNVNITGVTTTIGNIDINADLDVDGHTNLDNLSVAGVSTFSGPIVGTSGATINSVTIGIEAPSAISATASNLLLTSDGGTTSIANDLGVTGVSTFSNDVAVAGITTFYKDVHIKSGTNRLYLGTNDRLSLISDPSHSYLRNAGSGSHFQIHSNNFSIRSYDGNGSVTLFYSPVTDGNEGGGPRLYHNHGAGIILERLRTTKSGVNIVGTTTSTQLAVTGVSTFTGNIDANGNLDVDGYVRVPDGNESSGGNNVDGTWGDWTLQEGETDIFMINNRTGKKYKINMTEVD